MLRAVEPDSLRARLATLARLTRSRDVRARRGRHVALRTRHAPVAAEAEALLGALEDAEATVFASGMTAWTCICLTVLGEGRAAGAADEQPSSRTEILERFGVEVGARRARRRDFRRACDGAALRSSPPLLTDCIEARRACARRGVTAVRDSCATVDLGGPRLQASSAASDRAASSDARPIPRLAPLALARCLRTLHVRLPRQVATAAELARRLAGHPAVSEVHYPGLPGHPDHELALRQMPGGRGRRAGLRARRRRRPPGAARTACGSHAARPASAASRR